MTQPRRFGLVFQIDPQHPGNIIQQQALRDALHPVWGTKFLYLVWRLAVAVKKVRPHLLCGFVDSPNYPSLSSPAGINLSDKLDPAGVRMFARHEFGWLVNHYLLTDEDRQWFMKQIGVDNWGIPVQERFAAAVREWIESDGEQWAALTPILTREVP